MPEIITCPQCQRKLRLDETSLGQTVQCPSCQNTFLAERPTAVAPSPPPRPIDDEPSYRRDEPLPRRYDADYGRPRRRYDDDEDYPRPARRYYDEYPKAHRGTAVQVLGILALVFVFCQPVVGLVLAIISVSLGAVDLAAMNRGEMDPSGRGQTKTGLICGIIALVMVPVALVACIGFAILDNM